MPLVVFSEAKSAFEILDLTEGKLVLPSELGVLCRICDVIPSLTFYNSKSDQENWPTDRWPRE